MKKPALTDAQIELFQKQVLMILNLKIIARAKR